MGSSHYGSVSVPVSSAHVIVGSHHAVGSLSLGCTRVVVRNGQIVYMIGGWCGHWKHARYIKFHIWIENTNTHVLVLELLELEPYLDENKFIVVTFREKPVCVLDDGLNNSDHMDRGSSCHLRQGPEIKDVLLLKPYDRLETHCWWKGRFSPLHFRP